MNNQTYTNKNSENQNISGHWITTKASWLPLSAYIMQFFKWMKTVWDLGILQQAFVCLCIPRWLDWLPKSVFLEYLCHQDCLEALWSPCQGFKNVVYMGPIWSWNHCLLSYWEIFSSFSSTASYQSGERNIGVCQTERNIRSQIMEKPMAWREHKLVKL